MSQSDHLLIEREGKVFIAPLVRSFRDYRMSGMTVM